MPSAKNSIPSASNVLIAVNCSETVRSSWRRAMLIAKPIGTSFSPPSASLADSQSRLAIDGSRL